MPSTQSLDLSNVQAFQDYVQEYSDQLFGKIYTGFKTAMLPITMHEGVKGQLTLTELIVGALAVAWKCAHEPADDTLDFVPRQLTTSLAKVDLAICPQDYEASYLGFVRRTGQDPTDYPFQAYILEKVLNKLAGEMETAFWSGEITGAITPGTTVLSGMIDGVLEIIKDLVTGGHPVVTATADIVADAESMFDQLDPAYKDLPLVMFGSWKSVQAYAQKYRTDFGKYVSTSDTNLNGVKLDFGNVDFVPVPGMGTSDRLILTPAENIHYGYDGPEDASLVQMQQINRSLNMWIDFRIGVQIGITDPGCLVVNSAV